MKFGRIARRTAGAAALAVLAFFALVPTGRYLVRAGWAEARILWRARSIAELVRDPSTAPAARRKLELVLAARAFAAPLSAAYQDRLAYKTGCFPLVRSGPYKGYFDGGEAKHRSAALSRDEF